LLFASPSDAVEEGLHWGLAETPTTLMCALLVVDDHPRVEVGLKGIRGVIELLAERHSIELVQQCLMEPLAYAVGLRALHLGPGVVDILHREVELIFVAIVGAAIFGTTVG